MSKSNWTRNFEKIVKPVFIISAFLLLLLWGLNQEARAETSVELGGTMLSGQYGQGTALILSETWKDKYSIGFGYITKQEVTDRSGTTYSLRENVFVQGVRHIDITEKFNLGLGASYFNDTNRALGSQFAFSLLMRYDITDRWNINFRHYSNAGSKRPNMGQDMLTVGYRLGK